MLSFECIKNEKSVYFLLTSAFLKLYSEKYFFHCKYWAWRGTNIPYTQMDQLRGECCLHTEYSTRERSLSSGFRVHETMQEWCDK